MKEVKNIKSSIDEIIKLYEDTLTSYHKIIKSIKVDYPTWNEETDVRIVSIKLMAETLQTDVIILYLIKENFENLSLWELQDYSKISKNDFLNDRLYFVLSDIKSSLLIKIFMNYEHFIRIIASNLQLSSDSINNLSKLIVDKLKLNDDFKNLIDILTFSRNTIHFGGIHTKDSKSILYDSKKYEFIEKEHLAFFDDNTFHYLLKETLKFISSIINSDEIKNEKEILHSYSDFTFKYE